MKIIYDTVTCSRCDGSGVLEAFRGVHGGVCFKCHGSGNQLTAKGRAAKNRVDEVQKRVCVKTASQVKPGEKIIGSDGKVRTVVSVDVKLGKGNGGSNDPYTHEPVCLNLGVTTIKTQKSGFQSAAHAPVKMAWTSETLKVAADAVAKMSGAKVVA